jgi:two-component system sensor histidine kinase DesK
MRLLPKTQDWTGYIWPVYVVPFLLGGWFARHTSPLLSMATFVATIVFLGLYFRGYWVRGRELYLIIAAILAIGVAFLPFNVGAGAFFIFASSFSGFTGPPRHATRLIVLIELVLAVEVWLANVNVFLVSWAFFFTAIVGAITVYYEQVHRSNYRLRMAHEEIEQLAKMAERERIARDLHDVLGHTLSLIVLKSELASKLSTRDPERAFEEIRDVERISRTTLADVRAAVSGYRAGWKSELESCLEMLRAASIEAATEVEPLQMTPAQEAVLSICLREAVTNVVRHSSARRCDIALTRSADTVELRVSDDGRGGESLEGFGLTGMRERVTTAGGTFTRDGTRGTTITIRLPVPGAMLERSA